MFRWRPFGRSISILASLALLACGGLDIAGESENSTMSLSVELLPVPNDILFHETPDIDFALVNTGTTPIEVTHPLFTEGVPSIRMVNAANGAVVVSLPDSESFSVKRKLTLQPGERRQWRTRLEVAADLDAPGDYHLSLVQPFGDGETAESNVAVVTVHPSNAHNLAIASLHGAPGPNANAAWVNADPLQVVRATIGVRRQPKLEALHTLASVRGAVRPVVSAPANGTVSRDHWVAWLDGGALTAVHFSEEHGASSTISIDSDEGSELVTPLYTDALVDPAVRPSGAALVLQATPTGSTLRSVQLTETGAHNDEIANLAGPRPDWVHSFTRSSGERLIAYIQTDEDRTNLFAAAWPGANQVPRELAEWRTGVLLGAGASIDTHDNVHGALLSHESQRRYLTLTRWQLNADGSFGEPGKVDVPWGQPNLPTNVQIRLSNRAVVAVLLRAESGGYFVYQTGKEIQQLPERVGRDNMPVGLEFMTDFDAYLLQSVRGLGWLLLDVDGEPFSPH